MTLLKKKIKGWDFEKKRYVKNPILHKEYFVNLGYFYYINDVAMHPHQTVFMDGNWLHAKDAKVGRTIVMNDGKEVKIKNTKRVKDKSKRFIRYTLGGNRSYYIKGILVHNANRFWVGGTNTWNATATGKWSTTSGGSPGAAVPTSSDDVMFDSNSTGTCTLSGTRVAKSLNFTGFAGTFAMGTNEFDLSGSLTLGSGMSLTFSSGNFVCLAAGSFTLTLAGKTLCDFWVSTSSSTYTLQDSGGTMSILNMQRGTFDVNDKDVTIAQVNFVASAATTFQCGNGTITITGGTPFVGLNLGNSTLTQEGSTIKLTAGTIQFDGAGHAFNNVWFAQGSSTGGVTITGANTFADLKDDGTGTHTIIFPNATTTVTSWSISGTAGHLITLARTGGSGTFTVSKSSGTVVADYLSISNSAATGGATWYAGSNSTNGGSNTGWLFTDPPLTHLKTVNGLAKASVKTVNGLAIASVKTINGL